MSFIARKSERLQRRLRRGRVPLTGAEIGHALRSLGRIEAPVLMVHSSLSACGQIHGGSETVITELETWVGGRTLAMPTHSYSYPSGNAPAPCFDPESTPSVVGAITNCFRQRAGSVRSFHPTHSLACAGPLAREICHGHEWTSTPCGRGTPYEKLVELDCAVLMFGATLDGYTLFHTAEDAARVSYLYEPRRYELGFRDACGIEWTSPSARQDMSIPRRFGDMDTWLEARGLLQRVTLGLGELIFIPHAGAVHHALVGEMRRDPWLLVAKAAPKAEHHLTANSGRP